MYIITYVKGFLKFFLKSFCRGNKKSPGKHSREMPGRLARVIAAL